MPLTRQEKKAYLVAYKGGKCHDCLLTFPLVCFDFDHINVAYKSFEISQRMSAAIEILQAEADKCDLVCANCHRIRTAANPDIGKKISKGLEGCVYTKPKGHRRRLYSSKAEKSRAYRERKKENGACLKLGS